MFLGASAGFCRELSSGMAEEKALTGIRVVCPSTVAAGQPFFVGVKMLCKPYILDADKDHNVSVRSTAVGKGTLNYLDNVPRRWQGTIDIQADCGYDGPATYTFQDGRPCVRIGPVSLAEPGLRFLTVGVEESGFTARSNPILVSSSPAEERLFWGDIHCHTYYSDGLRLPEHVCAFARDEAFLDIFAITDHNRFPSPRRWEHCVNVSNNFNKAGHFVTLIGQEWEHAGNAGHMNIYYPDDQGSPQCHRFDRGDYPGFLADAREHNGLVIHHHPAATIFKKDWSLPHDPQVQRLVEIYSVWGNSERAAQDGNPRPIRVLGGEKEGQHVIDALKRGYRFGFIGASDAHDGRPGDELHTHQHQMREFDYHLLPRQGIVGVWAKELTREAVFQALYDRRVYATTNERVILRFSVNGEPMGSEMTAVEDKQSISVEAYSDAPIRRIDLVKKGEDLATHSPGEQAVRWTVEDSLPPGASTWYYARVTRTDGEMAWSSPIWVSR